MSKRDYEIYCFLMCLSISASLWFILMSVPTAKTIPMSTNNPTVINILKWPASGVLFDPVSCMESSVAKVISCIAADYIINISWLGEPFALRADYRTRRYRAFASPLFILPRREKCPLAP